MVRREAGERMWVCAWKDDRKEQNDVHFSTV